MQRDEQDPTEHRPVMSEQAENHVRAGRAPESDEAGSQRLRSRATGVPKPIPQPRQLRSSRVIGDAQWADSGARIRWSTRAYPALIDKMNAVVLLAQMSGTPAGIDTAVVFIHEALGRFIRTVEDVDKIRIPRKPGGQPAGSAKTPLRIAATRLHSDRVILDGTWKDSGPRKTYSTMVFPALIEKVYGVVRLSRTRGYPRGFDMTVKVFQEAIGRYLRDIEVVDGIEVPIPHRRE